MYENGTMSPADMAAVMGNGGYRNGNYGLGFGDGSWWIIVLFLFAMNGNWGNMFGGYGGGQIPYWMMNQNTNSDVQRGFDQSAVMSGINGINNAVVTGFGNVQNSLCNGFAGVNANLANGFAQAEIANNARQIADMNQNFAMQNAICNQLNGISMSQQNCCCENRAATADLKYTVATEACADRAAVTNALRDVTAQGVANTQVLLNAINAGFQAVKEQNYTDKIDAKNDRISDLERQLTVAHFNAAQDQRAAQIMANNEAQTTTLERHLAPNPIPAYIVQNPNCCGGQFGYGSYCPAA